MSLWCRHTDTSSWLSSSCITREKTCSSSHMELRSWNNVITCSANPDHWQGGGAGCRSQTPTRWHFPLYGWGAQQRHNNINTHGKQRDSNLGRRQTRAEVICQVQSPVLDVNLGAWTLAGEGILHNVPAHPFWSGEWTISLYTPRMWFGTWDTRKHAGCSGCIELQDCADGNRQIFLTSFQDGVVGCTIPLSALTFPPGKGGDLFESSRTRLCFHTPFFRKGHNNSS